MAGTRSSKDNLRLLCQDKDRQEACKIECTQGNLGKLALILSILGTAVARRIASHPQEELRRVRPAQLIHFKALTRNAV